MKTSKSKSLPIRQWTLGLVGLLVICSLAFAIPSGVAFADGTTTSTPGPLHAAQNNGNLANAFKREQTQLVTQQDNLDKTANIITRIQDLITKGQSKSLDTSALSAALATFQTQVGTAQSSHTTAANLLASHNGFDASGNVTDPV
ncbi:MAG TPA: hypothetical protein VMT91_09775, partial [Anaerolineales bacterium]|nr:hypothetical protein [Anaerolineales bacterium]